MRKNTPLILGGLILLGILFVIIFPESVTHMNPYKTQGIHSWIENGKFHFTNPPYAPSRDYLLGTDDLGRDILALLVYGTKLTMLISVLVVLGRFLVAVPMGLAAGFGSYTAKTIIGQFNVIFTAIPALLFSVIILSITFFRTLDKTHSIIAYVLILTLVGWGKLASVVMERVREILNKPFIKSELAIGKSNLGIAVSNVLPHLIPELVVLFFMEIAGALNIIMQLGVFAVFVGNLNFVSDTTGGTVTFLKMSFEPEWSSMLATSRDFINTAPWMVLFPAFAFFISIFGFNLFGEGLRNILQQRESRFGVYFRSLFPLHKSLGSFIKRLRSKPKSTLVVFGLLLVLGGFIITGKQANLPRFDYQSAGADQPGFANGVVIGTSEAAQTADYIARSLQTFGFEPMQGDTLIRDYSTGTIYREMASSITGLDPNGQSITLKSGQDYAIGSFGNINLSGTVFDARNNDLFALSMESITDKFVLIDSSLYSPSAIDTLTKKILTQSKAKGVLIILASEEILPSSFGSEVYAGVKVWLTPAAADQIMGKNLKVTLQSQQLGSTGKNVVGVLPATDNQAGSEAVMIGIGYNFLPEDQAIGQKRIQFGLELAQKLASISRNRKVIFSFWDGTLSDSFNGINVFVNDAKMNPKDIQLYLDLTQISTSEGEFVYYNADQAPVSRVFAFSFAQQLEKNLSVGKLEVKPFTKVRRVDEAFSNGINPYETLFYNSGIPTIIMGLGQEKPGGRLSLNDLGNVVCETIRNNSY